MLPDLTMSDVLYHYTTQTGLLGIGSTGTLWATKIQFLNDHSEFRLAFEDARLALHQRRGDSAPSIRRDFIDYAYERLEAYGELNVFVTSFSEQGNQLSQWRAYSKGEIGYSLGFRTDSLRVLATACGASLKKCIYNEAERSNQVAQIVDSSLSAFAVSSQEEGFDPVKYREKAANQLAIAVAYLSPLFKHKGFYEEREWRMTLTVPFGDVRLFSRTGRLGLVPTCRLNLKEADGKMHVHELIQGPAPDVNRAFSGLTSFRMEPTTLLDIEHMKPSYIPFRAT